MSAGSTGSSTTSSRALLEFTQALVRIRRDHPALHRAKFFQGRRDPRHRPHATSRGSARRRRDDRRGLGEPVDARASSMFLAGRGIDDVDDAGPPVVDDNFLLLVNASPDDVDFCLAARSSAVVQDWQLLVDTARRRTRRARAPGRPHEPRRPLAEAASLAPSRVFRLGGARPHARRRPTACSSRAGSASPRRAAIVPYLAELGVDRPLHLADHGGRARQHARLRRRRPRPAQPRARRRGGLRGAGARRSARTAWACRRLGAEPHGDRARPEPAWDGRARERARARSTPSCSTSTGPRRRADLQDTVLLPDARRAVRRGARARGAPSRARGRRVPSCATSSTASRSAPKSLLPLLAAAAAQTGLAGRRPGAAGAREHPRGLAHLPPRSETRPAAAARARAREGGDQAAAAGCCERRRRRCARRSTAQVASSNGTPGRAGAASTARRAAARPGYRLASWRVAAEEINYRRFFDINEPRGDPHGGPGGLRARARAPLPADRRGPRAQACASTTPTGSTIRSATSRRCSAASARDLRDPRRKPGRRRPAAAVVVEKILGPASGCRRLAGRRHHRLRVRAPTCCGLLVDRGAEATLTRAAPRLHRRRRARSASTSTRASSACWQESLAGEVNVLARRLERLAERTGARATSRCARCTRALVETLAAFPSTAPTCAPRTPPGEDDVRHVTSARSARRGAQRRPSTPSRVRVPRGRAPAAAEPPRRAGRRAARRVRAALPAAHRPGDGQVGRGHGLLPLQPADRAQRGRRRPRALRHRRRRRSTPATPSALRDWPLSMVDHLDARHQARRGRRRPHRRAHRDARRVGAGGDALDADDGAAPQRRRRRAGADPARPVHALPGARRRLAVRLGRRRRARGVRRAHASRYMEKVVREAKLETSWLRPNEAYEAAVRRYVECALARRRLRRRT